MTRHKQAMQLCSLLVLVILDVSGQDITFTNKTVTFTNLEGRAFTAVQITHGDWDGVIWRDAASGGRVCYTNLHPAVMEAWGIPTNRIEIARARAERKAVSDAQFRAARQLQAQEDFEAKTKQDALESIAAPIRARAEQKKAEAEAISALTEQIESAKRLLRRAEAAAHDYNKANRHNDYAPTLYVKDSERVKVEEAEVRLKKMKAAFALEYKGDR